MVLLLCVEGGCYVAQGASVRRMLEVVIAAVLAFAASWVLEGGRRKAARAEIKELIELADASEALSEVGALDLRAIAQAKLEAYVKVRWWEKVAWPKVRWQQVGTAVGLLVVVLGVPATAGIWYGTGGRFDPPSAVGWIAAIGIGVGSAGALTAADALIRRRKDSNRAGQLRRDLDWLSASLMERLDDVEHPEVKENERLRSFLDADSDE